MVIKINDLCNWMENLQVTSGLHPESTCGSTGSGVNSDIGEWFLWRIVQASADHA